MSDSRAPEHDFLDQDDAEDSVADYDDDDETAELRCLFPDGVADEAKAAEWKALFGG